ncbi:DNA-3-methyladenine glycosylase ii [Arthrobacter crystallopoietes BAB-32]|uniref:DNA-3-methyladenine glycosylase II n=1 Tax=Arthrobacter crystallopoietes BAB-32 TaxID=1246476 RepID=N1V8Y5_9MICC|nr:AlkA N-terminal domain-containing protein [Arthrobacter crystallopoietes]EMY34713.1 DNA-3-methyladenine glycosylase ii [Arthrobacter crystallopoietes BAB-32]
MRLPVTGPFDGTALLAALAAHAVPGLEEVDTFAGTCTRLFDSPAGPLAGSVRIEPDGVQLDLDTGDASAISTITTAVRRWLDLDLEPYRVVTALGADPLVGPLVAARPGLRIPGYLDGFEGAVCTVLGQQVSLPAARTFAGRLVAAFGTGHPSGLRSFPAPERLAAAGPDAIQAAVGLTGARARTVQALAEACADGLAISPDADHALIRRQLLRLPGIGPWTADYLAMRALHDRNAFPEGDLVLRRALGASSLKEVRAHGSSWTPLRAYAVFHLWTDHAYIP